MFFFIGKIFHSDEEIIPFKCYNAPYDAARNDVILLYKLRNFQKSEKYKRVYLMNVIYKLLYF